MMPKAMSNENTSTLAMPSSICTLRSVMPSTSYKQESRFQYIKMHGENGLKFGTTKRYDLLQLFE